MSAQNIWATINMRLPIPWRSRWGRGQGRTGRRPTPLESHALDDGPEEDVCSSMERNDPYENYDERLGGEEQGDVCPEVEEHRMLDDERQNRVDLSEDRGDATLADTDATLADMDAVEGEVDVDAEVQEADPEREVRQSHDPMVRGEAAMEDDRPHPAVVQEEPRRQTGHAGETRKAWYLSEPISVERWQSAPHLRSGFSVA
ncbi:g1210 [Coccomyxa elongata]